MKDQEKTLRSMRERLAAFCRGAFWIGKREESSGMILGCERSIWPITHLRVDLRTQDGQHFSADESDWQSTNVMLLDDGGQKLSRARLAILESGKASETRKIIAVSGDLSPVTGSVFVFASENAGEPPSIAINALFLAESGGQMSSILWDMSNELLTHWTIEAKLTEGREKLYGQRQYQTPTDFCGYDRDFNPFQYQQSN